MLLDCRLLSLSMPRCHSSRTHIVASAYSQVGTYMSCNPSQGRVASTPPPSPTAHTNMFSIRKDDGWVADQTRDASLNAHDVRVRLDLVIRLIGLG